MILKALVIIFYLCGIIGMLRLHISIDDDIDVPPALSVIASLLWPAAIVLMGIITVLETITYVLFGIPVKL